VAIVASHVVQYQVPLYRALSAHPAIDLTVLFCSRAGAAEYSDREFGREVRWDRSLLEGYRHEFIANWSRAAPGRPWSGVNPGLFTAFRRRRFDAVVVPGYAVVSYWLAYLGARTSGTPVLFRGEAVRRPRRSWPAELAKTVAIKAMLRGVSACLTIGSRSADFYRYYGVPEERLFFTPYTVDNEFFLTGTDKARSARKELRTELGLDPDLPVILFVGKLVPRKRPADLVAALTRMKRPAALLFVGEGSERPRLEQLREALAPGRIAFAGFQNQSELPRYYATADLFALPSSHEVSPLVLNEAMCAGLGLVVSEAVPSAVDLVEPGSNGYTHPCGDIDGLAEALERALMSDAHARELGRRSREKISAWSHSAVADGLLAALAHACGPVHPTTR